MPLYDRRPPRPRPALAARVGPPPGARDRRAPQHVEPSRLPQAGTAASVLLAGGVLSVVTAQPAAASPRGDKVVALAAQEQGSPYQWGAEGPDAFDCSGLVQFVYQRVGVALPRTAALQDKALVPVPRNRLSRGDVISFYDTKGRVFHNGIWAGGGKIWHAPATGKKVSLQRIWRSDWRAGRPAQAPAVVVLKQGSRGPAVVAVQKRLRIPADGEFGTGTTAAVKRFQKAHRITPDGQVGPATRTALFPPAAPSKPAAPAGTPLLKEGARGAAVVTLQKLLRIPADGEFGPGTKQAVVRFQKARRLVADGEVGARTWAALRR